VKEVLKNQLTLLAAMKGEKWQDGVHDLIYGQALILLGETVAAQTMSRVLNRCEWRPSRAELLTIGVRLALCIPPKEEGVRHIYTTVTRYGWYGKEVFPNTYAAGQYNAWKHPLLREVVARVGYGTILQQEEGKTLHALGAAWEALEEQYVTEVLEDLGKPVGERAKLKKFPVNWNTSGSTQISIRATPTPIGDNAPTEEEARQMVRKMIPSLCGGWDTKRK
jgi:hypothetical protein